jgi:hypothetical protein
MLMEWNRVTIAHYAACRCPTCLARLSLPKGSLLNIRLQVPEYIRVQKAN